ncbi:hypothetical protein FF011L_23250 [Roseimaritima multifibrata]|uniref:Uncharacterized protein n=1 Tax=Roseimaritima multifibrata TaxID=1930274 RepID=A0A517MF95_9BACT|nr:hypothetical protein FF011L_23250 [Roseimaritima multifibrata]
MDFLLVFLFKRRQWRGPLPLIVEIRLLRGRCRGDVYEVG